MNLLEFIEAGFNRAFDQLAKKQEEGIKMLATKIQDLSDAIAQTKLEVKARFDKSDATIADLNNQVTDLKTQVTDLQTKLQQAQQPTDTTDVEQDLDTLISDLRTIGK
ncbi:MAG: hypothetical protein RMZ41_003255 [Nostoc sp. DedVER02]|uniref:hypothetical protein n=1 Tax=unclassified Nostoc TaxID=2593658 RepID=UPI002AD36F78|nr:MULTISPECIES: hypothetical protein [unclassified Nostoc]MDZ7986826.1 hypothetical protein [Nostoc sp. DedVER02]MDZ8115728.1 hypothetical protein [Nostoc sp. DedVER01b]